MTEKEEREFVDLIKSSYFDLLKARRICGKKANPLVEGAEYVMRKLYQNYVHTFYEVPGRLEKYLLK